MSELLSFRIEYWDVDRDRWSMQSMGSDTFAGIMANWQAWVDHSPHTHYRLVLEVTKDVILEERGG
jgi:hypothetical protein